MKLIPIICVLLCLGLISSASGENIRSTTKAFKGMELYSFVEKGEIRYSLMYGTNRFKSPDEIRAASGNLNHLLKEIKTLAIGETIFWSDKSPEDKYHKTKIEGINFKYPDPNIMSQIKALCAQYGISLHIE